MRALILAQLAFTISVLKSYSIADISSQAKYNRRPVRKEKKKKKRACFDVVNKLSNFAFCMSTNFFVNGKLGLVPALLSSPTFPVSMHATDQRCCCT